jgi:predicted MFS family arabinose efflux permease
MSSPIAASPASHVPSETLGFWSLLLASGFFALTLSQPDVLSQPIQNFLKDDLRFTQQQMALFFFVAGFPWYLKIFAGLLSDAVPLFGTRRRHYLVFSALLAAAGWLLVGSVPRSYMPLMLAVLVTNTALVMASTVMGALLVESGQRLQAAGRLASVRTAVESGCYVVAGPLGGYLATLPFELASVVIALFAFSVAPVMWFWLPEGATAQYQGSALKAAMDDLRLLVVSPLMWYAAGVIFLLAVPQGFSTTRYYIQTDVLKLSQEEIGYLKGTYGAGCVAAAVLYGIVSKRMRLRPLLSLGILCAAAGTGAFVYYDTPREAFVVEGLNGLLSTFSSLSLMQIAILSTPRPAAAMGFATLMSVWNAGISAGDNLTAWLVETWKFGFPAVVSLYAAATVLLLALLLLMPAALVRQRDAANGGA